jgi:[acyl-carrier-protein] S-malonyltransferase
MSVSVGILFPGQGSQTVGMGADLFDARDDLLGARADEILGFSLRNVCLDGPEEVLTRTEHAQPALFALSYALWEMAGGLDSLRPEGAAGHSLGEYTALAAAGVFDFDSGLALVAERGRAMGRAASLEESGMAALLGADRDTAEKACHARREVGGRLQVANVNAPGQVVVAGGKDDLAWLVDNAGDMGIRRVVPLNVAGAFHSSFMEPAQADLSAAVEKIRLEDPAFPVWSNATAQPHRPDQVGDSLIRQLVNPVLFSDSLLDMASAGIHTFVHIGPGDVTAGLARRTVEGATVITISTIDDIRSAQEALVSIDRP